MPKLTAIRRALGLLSETAHKQMGLRRVRDALALGDRNPERVRELHQQAWSHLQHALALEKNI